MADLNLTTVQAEVLHLFFSLPESDGFVLAGGAGLVAVGLSERPTEDIDMFASTASISDAATPSRSQRRPRAGPSNASATPTPSAASSSRSMARTRRWSTSRRTQDAGPLAEPTITAVGPPYPAPELAGRKVLALFDRAALRDFIDVDRVSGVYTQEQLIEIAGAKSKSLQIPISSSK